jgi:general secretion pathway protein L
VVGNCLAKTTMSTLLRVYVDRSWPIQSKARWVLLAADGSLQQGGESEPRYWPESDDCEAVISGDQAVWHHVRVPERLPRGEFNRVLVNALEEKLIEEPDHQHLTVTDRRDGEVGVLVIARKRLRDIVAQFASIGRPLSRAYSELQTAPFGADGWHMALMGDSVVLRRHDYDGISLDGSDDGSPPPLLGTIVASSGNENSPVSALIVHGATEVPMQDVGGWAAVIDLEVRVGAPYLWYSPAGEVSNVLHGEFVPAYRHRAWLARVRPALWMAAMVVAADILLSGMQVGWLRYQLHDARERVVSMFRNANPNTPVVSPVAQTTRQLDTLRSPLGLLRTDDALKLVASVADSLGADGGDRIQQMRFEDGVLQVTLASSNEPDWDTLGRQLDIRGFSAVRKATDDGTSVLVIRGKQQ